MDWAIAFLARASSSIYQDVAKVMMLPDISHVYRQTAKLISTEKNKAKNGLHMNTIWSIGNCAQLEHWIHHQRTGVIARDLANINAGIEHDYITNTLKGGDKT